MIKTLVVAGGSFPKNFKFNGEKDYDFIIAADKGYEYLKLKGQFPNYLLGDFDSIDELSMVDKRVKVFTYPVDKSMTDYQLAIEKAIEVGSTNITIIGATGTRLDHTLINIFILEKYLGGPIDLRILDDHNEIFYVLGKKEVDKGVFKYLSVIPLKEETTLTLTGVKFPLNNKLLTLSDSLTISNEIVLDKAMVEANKPVIVIKSKD